MEKSISQPLRSQPERVDKSISYLAKRITDLEGHYNYVKTLHSELETILADGVLMASGRITCYFMAFLISLPPKHLPSLNKK